jgi:MoaA/NifB/PqqE/SkfB family radical SAM enzyme
MNHLTILYRGPLASCDYDCPYCPFAKRRDSRQQLLADQAALERFTVWVASCGHPVSVLFTPWGEGLVRPWYRRALAQLSHLPHVERVAIQTNLSQRAGWTAGADPARLALWATYHPGQASLDRFLSRTRELDSLGIRHSVGVVGLPAHYDAAVELRRELPVSTYLWVNAAEGYSYTDAEAAQWTALDPLFAYSRFPHPSRGLPCRTGDTVVSVDGDGTVRRCHFVRAVLGNLYDGSFRAGLRPAPHCPLEACDCHIGYVHLVPTGLYDVFAGGVLERIPALLDATGRPGA